MPVLASAALPPHVPGFYAWWINDERISDATPALPLNRPLPVQKPWSLLYIGICPKKPSNRTIEDRILKDHRGNSIGSSTFRFSLAALLRGQLALTPQQGFDRARISDEPRLGEWIDKNCGLTFAQCDQPWTVEKEIIETLCPPLNLKPGFHEFRKEVAVQRRRLEMDCGL